MSCFSIITSNSGQQMVSQNDCKIFCTGSEPMLAIPSWGCFTQFSPCFFCQKTHPRSMASMSWVKTDSPRPRPRPGTQLQRSRSSSRANSTRRSSNLGTGPPGLVTTPTATKRPEIFRFSGETKGETTGIAVMFLGDSSQ